MITIDALKASESLNGLSEEQMSAIAKMSEADENEVIANRFSEVYRRLDESIEQNTGIKREGAEKTYNYLARATKALNEKYADYDTLKTKVTTLEGELEIARKGGDEASKAQIASLEKELREVRGQYDTLKGEKDKLIKDHASELLAFKVDSVIAQAKEGLKFKEGMSESALKALVANAVAEIKKNNPSFEERDGESVLIFHDEEGSPLLNKENSAKPFTARELLIQKLDTFGVLAKPNAKGAGGNGGGGSTITRLSGVTTQVEANDAITKILLERGITRLSNEWQSEFAKLYKDNEVAKLPVK